MAENITGKTEYRKHLRYLAAVICILTAASMLQSCGLMHQVFSKKTEVRFDAAGGAISGKDVKESSIGSKTYDARCIVGDPLPDIKAEKEFYRFKGWYSEKEGGVKVAVCADDTKTLYARYESANRDRAVKISGISTGHKDNIIRISQNEEENEITVTFRINKYYGQEIAFTNRKGKVIETIKGAGEDAFAPGGMKISAPLPNRKWMDSKTSAYYIKSFGNDHVDEGRPKKFRITLDGQYEQYDEPVEGSMVWYGGTEEAPNDRCGVILATDDDYVYCRRESTNETEDGSRIYKWAKKDVMINLADVRTDIVYDIYNAYSSRFFPIKGKAMYTDNGGSGLSRYSTLTKSDAVHMNNKTGKTTFMVPVQWNFAEKVALAQSRAREAGYTLYIADSFRPMDSVDPVAKKVKDASLLAYGGTSAHNFGMAVDTGWQRVDENGEPVGEPFVKNLQALDKKKAVKGPHGNEREIWWQGVNKLPQEWWHYGDSILSRNYREHAKRVGSLYVNTGKCLSEKRSSI